MREPVSGGCRGGVRAGWGFQTGEDQNVLTPGVPEPASGGAWFLSVGLPFPVCKVGLPTPGWCRGMQGQGEKCRQRAPGCRRKCLHPAGP